jgi:hypothetical protein
MKEGTKEGERKKERERGRERKKSKEITKEWKISFRTLSQAQAWVISVPIYI